MQAEPETTWRVYEWNGRIVVEYHGYLTVREAEAAIVEFKQIVGTRHVVHVVIEASDMTGFEPGARQAWTHAITAPMMLERIKSVYLVGAKSTLVRMGFAVIGMLTRRMIENVRTLSDVPPISEAT